MAGETRGELAEAIAKVALEIAISNRSKEENVYWEVLPQSLVILPDLTIGKDKDSPINLFLVNACDSVGNSNMKFWRNIGEIFDAKSRLESSPAIFNLVFKSEIKPELIRLTEVLCDSAHNVDLDPKHGSYISKWLEANHSKVPSSKLLKLKTVEEALDPSSASYDSCLSEAINDLSNKITQKLDSRKNELLPLWNLLRIDFLDRLSKPVRSARTTMLRRGLARWLVFDGSIRKEIIEKHLSKDFISNRCVPEYARALGMLNVDLRGASIPNSEPKDEKMVSTAAKDLRLAAEFYSKASTDVQEAAAALCSALEHAPPEMIRAAELIRAMPTRVGSWHTYVKNNWAILTTPMGCYQALLQCQSDPTMGGAIMHQDENRVWLYDHLVAMLRVVVNRDNDFGYSKFVSYFKTHQKDPELLALFEHVISHLSGKHKKVAQRWIDETLPNTAEPGRRGFQEWLAGSKPVSQVIIAAFAFSLSKLISEKIKNPSKLSDKFLLEKHAYSLWNRLLTHQDFEPLLELIEVACKDKVEYVLAPTVMADLAEKAVQSMGYIPVLEFQGGLIYWQSVTDSGKDHKRKELCGRARALRYQKVDNSFSQRSEVKRLILVIDGTFNDLDLKVLSEAGWDEIYYPDEMNELTTSIEHIS